MFQHNLFLDRTLIIYIIYLYKHLFILQERNTKITILFIHHITTGHISMGRGPLSICCGFRSRGILSCGSSWSSFLVRKGDNRFQVEVKEPIYMQPEINNSSIKQIQNNTDKEYFRFLGFFIDDKLTWKHHIKHVIGKLKKANYILAKTKNLYNTKTKKLIYTSLGQSYIDYGTPIWNNNQSNTQILILQKKMIGNIANLKYNAHSRNFQITKHTKST